MNLPAQTDPSISCVLVVDDDDTVRLLISGVMEDAGYRVLTARDGAEALGIFASEHVDCIVTDVNMPNVNGFELCSRIRATPGGERVQVLFLTGLNDYESIQQAYEAGANDFSHKQINPMLLLERVRFLLARQADAGRTAAKRAAPVVCAAPRDARPLGAARSTAAPSPSRRWYANCSKARTRKPPTGRCFASWCTQRTPRSSLPPCARRSSSARAVPASSTGSPAAAAPGAVLRHQGEVSAADDGGPAVIRSTVQDVTDVRAQEDRIRFLAFHDPLTALPNRESAAQLIERLGAPRCRATRARRGVRALARRLRSRRELDGTQPQRRGPEDHRRPHALAAARTGRRRAGQRARRGARLRGRPGRQRQVPVRGQQPAARRRRHRGRGAAAAFGRQPARDGRHRADPQRLGGHQPLPGGRRDTDRADRQRVRGADAHQGPEGRLPVLRQRDQQPGAGAPRRSRRNCASRCRRGSSSCSTSRACRLPRACSAAPRRWCAGATRCAAWCRPASSFR